MQDRLKLTSSTAVEVTMHGVSEELKSEMVTTPPHFKMKAEVVSQTPMATEQNTDLIRTHWEFLRHGCRPN